MPGKVRRVGYGEYKKTFTIVNVREFFSSLHHHQQYQQYYQLGWSYTHSFQGMSSRAELTFKLDTSYRYTKKSSFYMVRTCGIERLL